MFVVVYSRGVEMYEKLKLWDKDYRGDFVTICNFRPIKKILIDVHRTDRWAAVNLSYHQARMLNNRLTKWLAKQR